VNLESAVDQEPADANANDADPKDRLSEPAVRWRVIRDGRESPKKCSVLALRGLPGVEIRSWVRDEPVDADGLTLLHPDGAPLSRADRGRPVLLLDSSWRHLPVLLRDLRGDFVLRSLPGGIETAYPRRSKNSEDPALGLASVEALYVASVILGDRRDDFLAAYRNAPEFLDRNAGRLAGPLAAAAGAEL
jgi:pre-rRNA-processing protein TSR3